MKKPLILIILPIIIFMACAGNKSKNTTMNNIITEEKNDILIVYTRQERSKDSNGTEIRIGLKNNTLTYHEHHWGFKAIKKVTEKKTKIDAEFLAYINTFISENLPNKNYEDNIEPNKKRAFNTFRYELFINKEGKQYKIDISTKNQNTDNKYYNNLETLFSEIKSKFKLKGKY